MIFISHSSKDNDIATGICRALEKRSVSCWISSRDIEGGENYQDQIDQAIRSASAMVLVFSRNANESTEIRKELALASLYKVAVIPVRVENAIPTGALQYELVTRQWIDLFDDRHEGLAKLEQRIGLVAERVDRADTASSGVTASSELSSGTAKRGSTARRAIAGVAALCLLGLLPAAFLAFKDHDRADPAQTAAAVPALRRTAAALSDAELDAMLTKLDFYEAQRNPAGAGIAHRYEPRVIGDAVVVVDRATGLMWQKGQSDDAVVFADAESYVDGLNARKYGGFSDWRLPTLEEAMTLVEPTISGNLHIAPQFKPEALRIWTSDREANGPNRFEVGFVSGVVFRAPPDSKISYTYVWVRAVRRPQQS